MGAVVGGDEDSWSRGGDIGLGMEEEGWEGVREVGSWEIGKGVENLGKGLGVKKDGDEVALWGDKLKKNTYSLNTTCLEIMILQVVGS